MHLKYYKVDIPLLNPFRTSFGTISYKKALIFELNADGITALSESVSDDVPAYGPEDNYTVLHIVKDHLVGFVRDLPTPDVFNRRAAGIRGNNMAKASVEMLLHDYHSRVEGKPLHLFIDPESRGYANVGISLGIDKTEKTVERISNALREGYKRIKVKIKKGYDVELLSTIRDHFPDIELSADANSDYSTKDFETLKRIDRYELVYLEQPLYSDDLVYHSKLAKELSTPICLDESITSPAIAEAAFDIGACQVVNIKPGRVGGLTNSLEIAKIARRNGYHCWVGGMLETGIGRSFNVALASSHLVDYPGDTSPNSRYFERDIAAPTYEMHDGIIKPHDGDGIGVHIVRDLFGKHIIEEGDLL